MPNHYRGVPPKPKPKSKKKKAPKKKRPPAKVKGDKRYA